MASMLLDEMHNTMRRRHYSIRTERSYCGWVKRYVLFHKMRSRGDLRDGEKKIEAFLNHLAIDLHVAPLDPSKRGRWFQSDLSINSERCNLVAPAPHDLKSQWHTIIFHENASSE